MRSGRNQWLFGSIIYIAFASIVYFLLTVLFTIIILLPVLEFSSGWGKVIGTFAQTSMASQHGISVPFSQIIFMNYTPFQAMLLSFTNCCLIAFILGVTIFVLNLKFTRAIGILVASALILWQITVKKTWTGFIRYSPVSWASLSNIDISSNTLYPSHLYVYSVLFSIALISILLSIRFMQKKDIQVLKSI